MSAWRARGDWTLACCEAGRRVHGSLLLDICGELGTPVAPAGRSVDIVTPTDGISYATLTRRAVPPHNDGLFLLEVDQIA